MDAANLDGWKTIMNTGQGHLLIVEDDPDILQLLKTTLAFHGYRVHTARNGYEGLEAAQQDPPALVIADIMMPRMDGFRLVNRLRMNATTSEIPVVLITATYVAPEDRRFAQDIGVASFIQKPIDLEEFLRKIQELLERGAPFAPEPFRESEFYDGYGKRLEAKLIQRNSLIARSERLLQSAPSEEERHAIQSTLARAIAERDELQLLLKQVQEQRKEL